MKKISVILILFSLIVFYGAWVSKSFELFCFALSCVSLAFAFFLKRTEKILISSASVFLTISLLELFIRVYWPTEELFTRTFGYKTNSSKYYEYIPGFGYRPSEGKYSFRKISEDDEIIYDVSYTIGSDGYRLDVPSTNYDIFIYGGSFTFGEGLDDNETLSYFLKEKHGFTSKNLGIHGYGLHQALYNIEHGKTFKSNGGLNILLTTPLHALRSSCKETFTGGTPRYVLNNKKIKLEGVCTKSSKKGIVELILDRSRFFRIVKGSISPAKKILANDIELYLSITKEIAKLTRSKGGKLIIAFLDAPNILLTESNYSNDSIIAEMKQIADGFVNVTLAESWEKISSAYYIHELDKHPSALANRARSNLIANKIHQIKYNPSLE